MHFEKPATEYFAVLNRLEDTIKDDNQNLTAFEADRKRVEILRSMREHLTFKVIAMERTVKQPSTMFSMFSNADNRGIWTKVWMTFKNSWEKLFGSITIWNNTIDKIEGKFGSGVGSFFRFLRLLLGLNFFSFLLW